MAGSGESFKYFVVDAFTNKSLKGNPAVVFLLKEGKGKKWKQAVASEFNLLTCYLTKTYSRTGTLPRYGLEWFAPASEVKICAHGTIASAYALFSSGGVEENKIEFVTQSGNFIAERIWESEFPKDSISGNIKIGPIQDNYLQQQFSVLLKFPLWPAVQLNSSELKFVPQSLTGPSTLQIVKMPQENDLIIELSSSKDVVDLEPIIDDIKRWPGRGVAVTGVAPPGSDFDFYTRLFSPNYGIIEDQVCGSIHCAIAPYWSKKLGKTDFKAYMASPRGGILELKVEEKSQTVLIAGQAVTVMEGLFYA